MSAHHKKLSACPNCGTALKPETNFCPLCGQENQDLHVPFSHLILELFESIFHFETKFFNTIKVIFTRPGLLTRDFWEGRRARYMHPFRLYVFVSFLFFLIANKVADQKAAEIGESIRKVENNEVGRIAELNDLVGGPTKAYRDSLLKTNNLTPFGNVDLQLPIDSAARYQAVRTVKRWDDTRLDSLLTDKAITKNPANRTALRRTLALIPDTTNIPSELNMGPVNIFFSTLEEREVFTRKLRTYSDAQIDSIMVTLKLEPTRLNRTFLKQLSKFNVEDDAFMYDVAHAFMKNLSIVMFILMPFVALLLLMVFYSRKRYYFEHLIFSIHAHTVLFILLAITLTIDYFAHTDLSTSYAFLLGWLYFLFSLKTVYGQGWGKTVLKFLVLSAAYLLIVSLFTTGALVWGLMTF